MAATADKVLSIAASQIGYREGRRNSSKFGIWYRFNFQPWCAMFVSWAFYKAGLPQPATTRRGFSACRAGVAWYKKHGRWGTTPRPGAVVFYAHPGYSHATHVGILERLYANGTMMKVIEGNTNSSGSSNGNGVYRKSRSTRLKRHGGIVLGYGYPKYSKAPAKITVKKPGPVKKVIRKIPVVGKRLLPKINLGYVQPGRRNKQVLILQKALAKTVGLDYSSAPGTYGPRTEAAMRKFESKIMKRTNAASNGRPDRASLAALAKRSGMFRV